MANRTIILEYGISGVYIGWYLHNEIDLGLSCQAEAVLVAEVR